MSLAFPSDDPHSISRIAIYIGLPTQEQRTIQSHIAQQVADLFRIPYARHVEPREAQLRADILLKGSLPENSELSSIDHLYLEKHADQFETLLSGSTCYTSLFGYWMGGRKRKRRMDDHTEIVEFLIAPRTFGVASLLIFLELVCPALFAADQDAVLIVNQHMTSAESGRNGATLVETSPPYTGIDGETGMFCAQQIQVSKAHNLVTEVRPSNGVPKTDISMIDGLRFILGHALSRDYTTRRLKDKPLENIQDQMGAWRSLLRESIEKWRIHQYCEISNSSDKGFSSDESNGTDTPRKHEVPDTSWASQLTLNQRGSAPKQSTLSLPTASLRVILDSVSWWLFYAQSKTIQEHCSNLEEGATEEPLWSESVCEYLQEECDSWLRFIAERWIGEEAAIGDKTLGRKASYKSFFSLNRASGDPLVNAYMWLAFLRDGLHFFVNDLNSYSNLRAGTPVDPITGPLQADAGSRSEWVHEMCRWIEAQTERRVGGRGDELQLGEVDPYENGTWFEKAYQELFNIPVPEPKAAKDRRTGRAQLRIIYNRLEELEMVDDEFFPDYHLVSAWQLFLRFYRCEHAIHANKIDKISDEDWWIETIRRWRRGHILAQLWLCPYVLDVCFKTLKLVIASTPSHRKTISLISQVADKALLGFPFRFSDIASFATDSIGGHEDDSNSDQALNETAKQVMQAEDCAEWIRTWQLNQ